MAALVAMLWAWGVLVSVEPAFGQAPSQNPDGDLSLERRQTEDQVCEPLYPRPTFEFDVDDSARPNMKGRCEHFLNASDIRDASDINVSVVVDINVSVVVSNSTFGRGGVVGVFQRTPKISSVAFGSCDWNLTDLLSPAGDTGGPYGDDTVGCAHSFRGFALSATGTTSQSSSSVQSRLPAGLSLLAAGSIKYDPQAADAGKDFSVHLQADLQDADGRRTRHTLFSLNISVIPADAPSKNQRFDGWLARFDRAVNRTATLTSFLTCFPRSIRSLPPCTRRVVRSTWCPWSSDADWGLQSVATRCCVQIGASGLSDKGRIVDASISTGAEHQINVTMYAGRRMTLPGFNRTNGIFWDDLVCEDFRDPNSISGYQWM